MLSLSLAIKTAWEFRHAVRRLRRAPVFAALAVGMFVVGIGVNAAMFSLMDALLFRPPFHVGDPDSVVWVQFSIQDANQRSLSERARYPVFLDIQSGGAFDFVAAFVTAPVSIGQGADTRPAAAMLVSPDFFTVLRASAYRGRVAPGAAVLSFEFWQRHVASDVSALGAPLTIDGKIYPVAGVMPPGFRSLSARPVDLWLPLEHASATAGERERRRPLSVSIVGRLRAGTSAAVTEERASASLDPRPFIDEREPIPRIVTTSIVPGRGGRQTLETRVALWLAGVSALVLLIACANVANLVLARAFAQRRESFIRLTLGASGWDLARRALADTCAIVLPAAAGAIAVSYLCRNVLSAYLSADIPLSRDLWELRTTGITAGSTLLAFLAVALASLSQLRRAVTCAALLAGTTTVPAKKGGRRTLLAVQAGLCLALLVVAGLFAMSLRRVEALDLGVDVDRTIQVEVTNAGRLPRGELARVLVRAREALAQHPGAEGAALAAASPYRSGTGIGPWTAERTRDELWANREDVAYRSVVGAGFFSVAGTRSLRGRDFSDEDKAGAPRVAIVNAPLAAYVWPGRDPLGECMRLDDDANTCYRVVGILGGVWKFSALERDRMAVYLPLAQVADAAPTVLFVRSRGDARAFVGELRAVVQSLDANLPAARATLLRDSVEPEFRPWRLGATVFSAFATVALLIAAIGVYGVVAITASLRMKEIGVRIALGARRAHVLRVVLGEGILSVAAGLAAGAGLVALVSRWLGGVLYETSPADPVVIAATAGLLLVVSLFAVMAPVIRAFRLNPVDVLRCE